MQYDSESCHLIAIYFNDEQINIMLAKLNLIFNTTEFMFMFRDHHGLEHLER